MSQNHSGRLLAIAGVLVLALVAIFWPSVTSPRQVGFNPNVPFSQKTDLKPGIDIAGGTSLLYQIKQPEGMAPNPNLAEQVMQALKKRVDENGTRNLIWRPQGSDRLEIQMPLSSGTQAAEKQQEMENARTHLEETNVRVSDAIDALEGKNGKTRADFDKMVATAPAARQSILKEMASAYDAMQAAHQAHNAEAEIQAQDRLEAAKKALDATNLSPAQLDTILGLSVSRERELAALQKKWAHFPQRLAAVNAYIAAVADLKQGGGALESAADLKKLLRGSGVLEFHIVPEMNDPDLQASGGYQAWVDRLDKQGPRAKTGDKFRWYEVERPEEFKNNHPVHLYNDHYYILLSVRPEDSLDKQTGAWALTSAQSQSDNNGANVVAFTFDNAGGQYFGRLTTKHLKQAMAILLDNKVISAPVIQSPITTGSGVITGGGQGGFSRTELDYLVRMLSAGSLPAQLAEEPISERTVGPQLGQDNLIRGLLSCGIGLVIVSIFLIVYYYRAGMVAVVAIFMNVLLICGIMAALNATFTLPGIAAIVLTIGTAVDANVLIFERLREEEARGLPLRMALRNGYDRAFSAIVDSNMTTIITSVFLIMFGTEEVKGFGITLIIGILCSLFTALFVTRTIFGIMIDTFGVTKLGSIPLSFPKWDKLLKPHWDWMGMVWIFYTISAIFLGIGLTLFVHYARAGQMLDIEFASGTAVTFELKQPIDQEKVRALLDDESRKEPITFPSPTVQRIGSDGTTWEATVAYPDARKVREAVLSALAPLGPEKGLKAEVPSQFAGVGEKLAQVMNSSTPIIVPLTAENISPESKIKWPGGVVPEDARTYGGGVAIMLHGLNPPLSAKQIKERIDRQMLQASAHAGGARAFSVVTGAPPDQRASEAVVFTNDPELPYEKDQAKWREGVVAPMWTLIEDAISHPAELQQVKNFDPSVAGDTQRDALVALTLSALGIMAYVWIRFGNLKYGTATVISLLHDVLFTIAALGFAHLLSGSAFGDVFQLEPFRINLTVVAGILTIMGYSMIDTIVVFDRIRENRGKYGHLGRHVVNEAITQTLSRTLLTAGATIVMVAIMYFVGGAAIHGFTFVLLIGILVGTYSSIAIASPFLLIGKEVVHEEPGSPRAAGQLTRVTT